MHGALSLAAGIVMLAVAGRTDCEAAAPRYEYQAAWIAVASPEPVVAEVERKSWTRLVTFRPERGFAL